MKDPQTLISEATVAANTAGEAWLAERLASGSHFMVVDGFSKREVGRMLDLCGNAHLKFKDKRTKIYKQFAEAGHVDIASLSIPHKFQGRQEHGLHVACMRAALKSLTDNGVPPGTITVIDYVD